MKKRPFGEQCVTEEQDPAFISKKRGVSVPDFGYVFGHCNVEGNAFIEWRSL